MNIKRLKDRSDRICDRGIRTSRKEQAYRIVIDVIDDQRTRISCAAEGSRRNVDLAGELRRFSVSVRYVSSNINCSDRPIGQTCCSSGFLYLQSDGSCFVGCGRSVSACRSSSCCNTGLQLSNGAIDGVRRSAGKIDRDKSRKIRFVNDRSGARSGRYHRDQTSTCPKSASSLSP